MKPDETIEVGPGEKFTCIRSASNGGTFEFRLEMEPGVDGPPVHKHCEDESIAVLEGEVVFVVKGQSRRLKSGDELMIPKGTPHTFRVPKDSSGLKAICRSGIRFERSIDQHAGGGFAFGRLSMYLTHVDPHATYMVNPVVRATLRLVAWIARIGGVRPRTS